MGESIQKRLGRVRPPRVQITYDVEVGDAIVKKELPFVMGIMADLAGDRTVREGMPASGRMALSLSHWAQQPSASVPTPPPRSSLSPARQS